MIPYLFLNVLLCGTVLGALSPQPLQGQGQGQGQGQTNFSGTAIVNPRTADGSLLPAGQLTLVVIDTARDGFGAALEGSLSAGEPIATTFGGSDDLIVGFNASGAPVPNVLHQALGSATIELGSGIDSGDPFAVVFFDGLDANDRTLTSATRYALVTHPTWMVPGAGASLDFRSSPTGQEFQQLSNVSALLAVTSSGLVSYAEWIAGYFEGTGFAANTNFGLTAGDDISTYLGESDDLIIGSNLSFEMSPLFALPGTASFSLGNGVDTGDPFGLFFFDNLSAGSTTVTENTHYGFATHSSWLIPGDGANVDFQSSPGAGQFQQLSGFQTAFSVSPVPEPHSAGLLSGLIGFFCLTLQRRRSRRRSP